MTNKPYFSPSPWDSPIFNMPCFEVIKYDEQSCQIAGENRGHYTIKVDPLADKKLLHRYGFYYTDTLLEPCCKAQDFKFHQHPDVTIVQSPALDQLLPMCETSFLHGRFHRDFFLSSYDADRRYQQWLSQLHAEGHVLGLMYKQKLAGFIAHKGGNLLLHTIIADFRGQGLAKFFWSQTIEFLLNKGETDIQSSISASNLAVLNLYISLGFRFHQAVDIYHKLTR